MAEAKEVHPIVGPGDGQAAAGRAASRHGGRNRAARGAGAWRARWHGEGRRAAEGRSGRQGIGWLARLGGRNRQPPGLGRWPMLSEHSRGGGQRERERDQFEFKIS